MTKVVLIELLIITLSFHSLFQIQRNKREKQMMELANEALIQENLGSKAEVEYLKRCLAKGIMEVQMKSTMSQILVQFQKLNN